MAVVVSWVVVVAGAMAAVVFWAVVVVVVVLGRWMLLPPWPKSATAFSAI